MPAYYAFFDKGKLEELNIDVRNIGGPCEARNCEACVGMFTASLVDGPTPPEEYQEFNSNPNYVKKAVAGN